MSVAPFIKVDDLHIRYTNSSKSGDSSWALQGVSFEVTQGDRLGILGRNGSGKSTLLRTLAGIYLPERGQVEVVGDVASIFNASLGFVPEATGWENIFLRGAVMGLSLKEAGSLAPSIIEFAQLGDWIHEPLSRYSSGMALRLAFAITTAVSADVLLMDEWLGAGDAEFIRKARVRMREVVEQSGLLVLATHNLQLMRNICNKAMIIDAGKIVSLGEIDDVVAAYRKMLEDKIVAGGV
ncbi:ABC transporter related protein [Maricaulis maris MCS10]|jgi:ABC-type polysaccharide/polyol phosphate transport system ATPase subunit|uniref:ABC transporter related protein n=1 Tax=Maricaulis maris (strain MCS10) TaxID=394221 RepID=Q0ALS3_MARMM|nr:ABC transporter ATP-binding protein [Maricaulis maris]ABI66770.1 ABC transporter related protein [Maricaulis maris MCS10]